MDQAAPSSASGTRRRNARGDGRLLRAELVAAASDLLIENGDAGAITLRAVARRAGVAATSIYPHFDDAQQILLAVVVEQFEALQTALRAAVDDATDGAVSRLQTWCSSYLDYARERPQHYLVMFGGVWVAAPAIADEAVDLADVEALGADLIAFLAQLLAACVAEGVSASTDPEGDASLLWVGLHGLAQQRIASPAFTWRDDAADRLTERLALLERS